MNIPADAISKNPLINMALPSRLADILNSCGRVALGADHVHRRVEKPRLRFASAFYWSHRIPTSWY